jgi:hypothetical protein
LGSSSLIASGQYTLQERFNTMSNEGSVTVNQVDAKSFAAALWNPPEYEIYIDDRKVGLLNGYQNQKTFPISPGATFSLCESPRSK